MLRIGNPTMGCGMHFQVAIGTVLPRPVQRMVLHRQAGTSDPLLRARHTGWGMDGTAGLERNAGSRFLRICRHGNPVSLGSVLYKFVPKNRMFRSHRGIGFQYYQTSHRAVSPGRAVVCLSLHASSNPARSDCVSRNRLGLFLCVFCLLY